MIVGLGASEWDASSSDDVLPGQESVWSVGERSTPQSTITIGPMTIRTATPAKKAPTQPRTGITKVLDKVAPKTLAPNGTVRVWGMPPAVAYVLMALAVGGVGFVAYRSLAGGGRRVTNPRRRRRGAARGRGRWKR